MKFKITCGDGAVEFDVPDQSLPKELPFVTPRKPNILPEMADIEGRINTALRRPIGSPELKDIVSGKRVALIVSDEFRAGQHEKIIKYLLAEIAKGHPRGVWTFCATGSHEPDIYAKRIGQWAEKYAAENGLAHRFFAHDCMADCHVAIGKCSDGTPVEILRDMLACDVRVYGHESKHHYMNGYSCIDKQVLPGLCSRRTIEMNHKNALDDRHSFAGRNVWVPDENRRWNPFSQGTSDARRLADSTFLDESGTIVKKVIPTFGLDMISDAKYIYWIAAGSPDEISRKMPSEVDRLSAFEVWPTRYVVISPGGPPASQTIYGTQNCFDMALSGAIEDGGEALVIAPCEGRPDVPAETRGLAPDGKSKKLFYDNLARLKDLPLGEATKWIADNFELYLWKTDRVLKLMNGRKIKIYLHSALPDSKVRAIGFIPANDIQSWIDERALRCDSPIRVIDHGNKILVMKK